jgi:hypothetical protein
MRKLVTLVSVLAHLATLAQRPSIATLLSLADCLDTTCVSERLRAIDYCLQYGREKDGWVYRTCGTYDQWAEHDRMVSLGFFGYSNSNYRDYLIITGDTALADTLTAELHQLGFNLDRPLRYHGHGFSNVAYPMLEVHRSEKRSGNLHYKRLGDPVDPRALPVDTLGCDHEHLQKMAQEAGYDSYEVTEDLRWVFKVTFYRARRMGLSSYATLEVNR